MSTDSERIEHEQLLAEHKEKPSIGGSVASVVALETAGKPVPFGRSMFGEWMRLTGRAVPRADTDRFEMGRLLEEPLAIRFQRATDLTLSKVAQLTHPKYEWVTGHMDRAVNEEPGDVELKTVEWDRDDEWSDPALKEPNRVPMLYLLQAVWYNGIPYDNGWEIRPALERNIFIAAQFGFSHPLRIYKWEPSDSIRTIHAAMLEACHRFWEDYVLKDTPPPAPTGNPQATKDWLKYRFPEPDPGKRIVDGTMETVETARLYKEASAKVKQWQARKDSLGNHLAKSIGDAYGIQASYGSAKVKVSWPLVEKDSYIVQAQKHRSLYVTYKDSNEQPRLGSAASESEVSGGSDSG